MNAPIAAQLQDMPRPPIAAVRLVLTLGALLTAGCGAPRSVQPLPVTEATIAIHHSRFETSQLAVPAGVPITITLRNDDPIEHEWIAGPAAVHAAHRTGTEAYHEGRPNEITLPPYASRTTTLTFDRPGDYLFVCHLPGHEAYGMTGILHVRSS
jgi:uncharacterized cupredoxin-like copper-binding protein